jgi:hypothetical protein
LHADDDGDDDDDEDNYDDYKEDRVRTQSGIVGNCREFSNVISRRLIMSGIWTKLWKCLEFGHNDQKKKSFTQNKTKIKISK